MGDEAWETLQWLLLLVYCSLLGRQLAMQGRAFSASRFSEPACIAAVPALMYTAAYAAASVLHHAIFQC